jgi:hypothetical protein
LADNPLAAVVSQLVSSIKVTPITYSKIAYFRSARSIILFAHAIADDVAPIEFPATLSATTTLQLTACSTFSDYLRFGRLEMKGESLTKTLLLILQKTGDSRAGCFLESLNASCSVQLWVEMMKRILLTNSLLDDNVSAIEPNCAVKAAIIRSSLATLVALSEDEQINTEYLDDFVASICHSIESSEIEIQEEAFPVLEKVISVLQYRKSEDGGRLLDLYDIQFSVAVRSAFLLNLEVSGSFLSAYLLFATQTDYNPAILTAYMNGLVNCQQRSSSYYYLLTRLCIAGQKCSAKELKSFLAGQLPVITGVITQAIQLRKNDWKSFAVFRTLFADCYSELIPAFVWICAIANERPMDVNVMLSFFLIETWCEKESWKFSGAFNGIPLVFEYLNDPIDPQLIDLVLQTSLKFKENPNFAKIIQSCAKLDSLSQASRQFLLTLAFQNVFDAKMFAWLLKNDKDDALNNYAFSVSNHFVENSGPAPLFQLLFDHSPFVIGFTIDRVLKGSSYSSETKLEIIQTGLLRFRRTDFLPLRAVAKFLIGMLKSGGLEVIASLLLRNPIVGIALLSEQMAKAVYLLALNDLANSKTFLQFVHLMVFVTKDQPIAVPFARSAFRAVVLTVSKHGRDPQRGPQIVMTAVQLLNEIRGLLGDGFSQMFGEIPPSEKATVCDILRLQIGKAELRRKNASLASFSTGSRTRKSGDEWQTLEIGDSD